MDRIKRKALEYLRENLIPIIEAQQKVFQPCSACIYRSQCDHLLDGIYTRDGKSFILICAMRTRDYLKRKRRVLEKKSKKR